jgi:hypothetical protein
MSNIQPNSVLLSSGKKLEKSETKKEVRSGTKEKSRGIFYKKDNISPDIILKTCKSPEKVDSFVTNDRSRGLR